jgi:hypothetical protein
MLRHEKTNYFLHCSRRVAGSDYAVLAVTESAYDEPPHAGVTAHK